MNALLLSTILLATTAHAADWLQFRGPNGQGYSGATDVPVEFGPAKNVVWKTPLPPGHSSPILVGDHIFLTGAEGEHLLTICLDRKTGQILWKREAPRPRKEGMQPTNSGASPTPASDGRNVYVFFGDFGMLSYGPDGNERWRLPLGPFNNPNGHGSSPIIADGKVVLICDQDNDSYIFAADKDTGKVVWNTPRPEVTRGYATPVVYRPKSGPAELIIPGSYILTSYALETGEKLWWVTGLSWQAKSVAVIKDDVVYVNSWEIGGDTEHAAGEVPSWEQILETKDANKDGKITESELDPKMAKGWREMDLDHNGYMDEREWKFYVARRTVQNSAFAVRLGGRGDVTATRLLWRYRKAVPNIPSPLLYQDTLFLVKEGGILTSLKPETGEVLKQDRLTNALGRYWASPVLAEGRLYAINEACKVSVIKAAPRWEVLAQNSLEDDCFATPAVEDGRIYIRTRTALYCFGRK